MRNDIVTICQSGVAFRRACIEAKHVKRWENQVWAPCQFASPQLHSDKGSTKHFCSCNRQSHSFQSGARLFLTSYHCPTIFWLLWPLQKTQVPCVIQRRAVRNSQFKPFALVASIVKCPGSVVRTHWMSWSRKLQTTAYHRTWRILPSIWKSVIEFEARPSLQRTPWDHSRRG